MGLTVLGKEKGGYRLEQNPEGREEGRYNEKKSLKNRKRKYKAFWCLEGKQEGWEARSPCSLTLVKPWCQRREQ